MGRIVSVRGFDPSRRLATAVGKVTRAPLQDRGRRPLPLSMQSNLSPRRARQMHSKLTYATVVASLALFVALGVFRGRR